MELYFIINLVVVDMGIYFDLIVYMNIRYIVLLVSIVGVINGGYIVCGLVAE